MTEINFNNLPADIKSMIFKINKDAEKEDSFTNKNKIYFTYKVLNELNDMSYDKYEGLLTESAEIFMNIKNTQNPYESDDYESSFNY